MPNCRLPLVKLFAVGILMLILIQAAPTVRAYETGNADRSFPLGFGYCPQPVSGPAEAIPQIPDGHPSQVWLPIDTSGDRPVDTQPAAITPDGALPDTVSDLNVQDAFQPLQTLKRGEDPLAPGNVGLLALLDTGQSALGSPVKFDFKSDPIHDQNQQPPESLAMFLLGAGLIGFARIQRRQLRD